jgi:hypothetical protein
MYYILYVHVLVLCTSVLVALVFQVYCSCLAIIRKMTPGFYFTPYLNYGTPDLVSTTAINEVVELSRNRMEDGE